MSQLLTNRMNYRTGPKKCMKSLEPTQPLKHSDEGGRPIQHIQEGAMYYGERSLFA